MDYQGHCVKCKKKVKMQNTHEYIWNNNKSKLGKVRMIQGHCPCCQTPIYKILGHL